VVRLDGASARLAVRAMVAQDTGEDWRGVRLALSTADALSWTELPELPGLRIGRRQPPPPRAGWRAPPAGAELLYADWDRAFAGRLAPPPRARPEPMPLAAPEPAAELEVEAQLDELMEEPTDVRSVVASLGAPPPAPMYAAQAAPKRGGGIAAAIGGVVAAPAALLAAGAGALARSRKGEREQARQSAPGRAEAAAAPAELIAPADLLAYGDLRMPPPTSPARGRLVPASRRELYLSIVATQHVTVSFDVLVAIEEAERRAAAVADRPPPPGLSDRWSESYDHAFRADGAVEVPSDGGWHAIALASRDAAVALHHVVVPRESCDVFRIARLDNPHDAPLLPGPIDVYDGPDFVLSSRVELTAPRGRLELALGVDQRVKAARRSRFREETAGMLRGSLRLEHEVEIDVENLTGRPVDVEVRERVPVRQQDDDDDVEIAIARVAPAWEDWAPEPRWPGQPRLRGGHRWRVALAAGEKRTLALEYHVKIASKHELVGGNRREA
jgi:hypothetical protein